VPEKPPDPHAESMVELRAFLPAFLSGTERVVVELRALGCPREYGGPITRSGFFDLPSARKEFALAVRSLLGDSAGQPEAIYVTLNALDPNLLARANNRLKGQIGKASICAADANVLQRRWLLIDVDPVRISGVSATNAETNAARAVLDAVRGDLDTRGWPAPITIDSGNGYHAWYRIDLPADDDGMVKDILATLARKHNTAAAKVDTSVFNASRIAKLPGTWARKGDSTPERPHRMARVLEVPDP
jgi:hypothetical protein